MEKIYGKKSKTALITLFLMVFTMPVFAINSTYKNILKEINIKKAPGGSYYINLIFNKNYTEPLSITKKAPKNYDILLPETQISSDNVKISYKDGKDKVKIKIDEFPYLDKSINNGYVKITAVTTDNSLLKVVSNEKLLPNIEKIPPKNVEIVNKQLATISSKVKTDSIPPIQAAPPVKMEEKKQVPTEATTEDQKTEAKTEEPLRELPSDLAPPTKNPWDVNYFDILVKISLVLFVTITIFWKLNKYIKTKYNCLKPACNQIKTQPVEDLETSQNTFESEIQRQQQAKPIESKTTQNRFVQEEIDDEDENVEQMELEEEYEVDQTKPKLLSNSQIEKNKGFYLIKYDGESALIGYIGEEIFVIKRFDKVFNPNLQTRLHERGKTKSNYLVRVDNYKALVEVSETQMKAIVEF